MISIAGINVLQSFGYQTNHYYTKNKSTELFSFRVVKELPILFKPYVRVDNVCVIEMATHKIVCCDFSLKTRRTNKS